MMFSADFLDEIRARVNVSEVVGRYTPLVRQGGRFVALCPFHDDKKPSLNLVDSKNFYHCFACGANGDVFAFVMGTEGLGFSDAVEKLAGLAGLEMPRQSPEERRVAAVRKTQQDVMEAACTFFETMLRDTDGSDGLQYLRERGLIDETIARFRLGYAPQRSTALREAMAVKGLSHDSLLQVGLLRKPDDNSLPYDYFRGRVVFPITDRRGRVIAFGGRALGDSQPKYLNSPETELFQKGRVLYGHAQAAEAAVKTGEVIVAEGYMDVIALAQNGFPQAVAPLGTALTEDQIRVLWRLAREPVVCFDGDQAGQKAAVRAAGRALPILAPGCSLRFVLLPAGQDPDDLVGKEGAGAMRKLIHAATGLADFIWNVELGLQPVDTPERWADFARRIRGRVREIADRGVQAAYHDTVEARLRAARGSAYDRGWPGIGWNGGAARPVPRGSSAARARVSDVLPRRQDACVIAAVLNHPVLLEEFGETLGLFQFEDTFLDRLRQDILDKAFSEPGLDVTGLRNHLKASGYDDDCGGVLGQDTLHHAAFARAEASVSDARAGLCELLTRLRRHQLQKQLEDATQAFQAVGSEVNWNRVAALTGMLSEINAGPASGNAV